MRRYLLPESGKFYKSNLHVHTDISDGKITPEEAKEGYKSHGYSVLAYTDHEVFVPHNDLSDEDFIALNAVEIAINDNWPGGFKYNKTFHLNLYARSSDIKDCFASTAGSVCLEHSKAYLSDFALGNKYKKFHSKNAINDLIGRAAKEGFLVCYNHPVWSLHNYTDYSGLSGLWGIEVYNTASERGGYGETAQPFEDMLNENQRPIPIAADDAHRLNGHAYGGWTMIKADALNYDSIISALERGDCYSSNGPEIKELYVEDGIVYVTTSEAVSIRLKTNIRFAKQQNATASNPITEASLDINEFFDLFKSDSLPYRSLPWFRVEVTDAEGKRAWSRAYFLDEIG